MASSCSRGGLDWLLGKKNLLPKRTVKHWNRLPRLSTLTDMTLGDRVYWWTCSTGLMAGFIDLKGLLKPK